MSNTSPSAQITRDLFGIRLVCTPGHPAEALVRRLGRDVWLFLPGPDPNRRELVIALTAEILPTMRAVFRLEHTTFSAEALAALKHLRDMQRAMEVAARRAQQANATGSARLEITPEVSPALRGLPASTDPSAKEVSGGLTPPPRARSSED